MLARQKISRMTESQSRLRDAVSKLRSNRSAEVIPPVQYHYLSIRAVYPRSAKESDASCVQTGWKTGWKRFDDRTKGTAVDTSTAETQGWTTIPLPAVLGRRNLVETWWSDCPTMNCHARDRCQRSTSPQKASRRLFVCDHCKPLVNARHVLSLSKDMVHIGQDGTVTVTAKHNQLVYFDDLALNRSSHDGSSKTGIGTISIGTRPSHKTENESNSRQKGVWMRFQFQLKSKDDKMEFANEADQDKDSEDCSVSRIGGNGGRWQQAKRRGKYKCGLQSAFTLGTRHCHPRRRVLLARNSDTTAECEDDSLLRDLYDCKGKGQFAALGVDSFEPTATLRQPSRQLVFGDGGSPSTTYKSKRRSTSPTSNPTRSDSYIMDNSQERPKLTGN